MTKRAKMLASIVREFIAPVIQYCPEECGIVSITEVIVSDDFSYADVYVSALKEPLLAVGYLEGRAYDLQQLMGKMERKKIPVLRFHVDERGDKGSKIENLIDEELKKNGES